MDHRTDTYRRSRAVGSICEARTQSFGSPNTKDNQCVAHFLFHFSPLG